MHISCRLLVDGVGREESRPEQQHDGEDGEPRHREDGAREEQHLPLGALQLVDLCIIIERDLYSVAEVD
jgi:hypothetical protein